MEKANVEKKKYIQKWMKKYAEKGKKLDSNFIAKVESKKKHENPDNYDPFQICEDYFMKCDPNSIINRDEPIENYKNLEDYDPFQVCDNYFIKYHPFHNNAISKISYSIFKPVSVDIIKIDMQIHSYFALKKPSVPISSMHNLSNTEKVVKKPTVDY